MNMADEEQGKRQRVKALLCAASRRGYVAVKVWDEEEWNKTGNISDAPNWVMAVDNPALVFHKATTGQRLLFQFALENDIDDIVVDFTHHPHAQAIWDEVFAHE